jgi:hypothetical protein
MNKDEKMKELPESLAQEEIDERIVSGCRFAEETCDDPESCKNKRQMRCQFHQYFTCAFFA